MAAARDVIAGTMMQQMFAPHELPLPGDLHARYFQIADAAIAALLSAPEPVRQELAALLSPCRSINPWRLIDEATDEDKDGYVLGFVVGTKLPMVALWDDDENRWFALNKAFKAEWNPTHFMRLPGPPSEDKI